jgi:hypothetical protein
MHKLNELKPGSGYELLVTVDSVQPLRALWKCFECKKQGMWRTEDEIKDCCPECGAIQSPQKGRGVWIQKVTTAVIHDESGKGYLDLWNKEIIGIESGVKLHLLNIFVKSSPIVGIKLTKGKFGAIEVVKE